MKYSVCLIVIAWCLNAGCHQTKEPAQTNLPLTLVNGYGPFQPGFGTLGNKNKNDPEWQKFWGKLSLPVRGVPRSWTNVEEEMVWLNTYQLIYQNFLAGNFTTEQFKELQKSWKWSPDSTKLSEKPIKCYVYVVKGFNEKNGKWAVLVDTNNNLDFNDETAIYPDVINWKDPYSYQKPKVVQYETYRDGKVVKATVPMVIKAFGSEFLYNFPQFATTKLRRDGKDYSLAITSGFTRPDFENPALVDLSSIHKQQRMGDDKLVKVNENIVLGGITYKNRGVDLYNNTIQLDPVEPTTKEFSLQVGYPFRPFSANEFTTKRPISLVDYRGKYVFVDFWGTWCEGCVADIPSLTRMYQGLNKTRFEFIGIVSDSPDRLTNFIKKKNVKWPQILSDSTNKLVDLYGVTGFPTSVLIDPAGIVIARNLRGESLANKLRELDN